MKILVVVAAIVRKSNKFLIAQRLDSKKWEFPGGKVEWGEAPEQSLVREMKEELGIVVKPVKVTYVTSHLARAKQIIILFYQSKLVSGIPIAKECLDWKWVSKKDLTKYEFEKGDLEVIADLI